MKIKINGLIGLCVVAVLSFLGNAAMASAISKNRFSPENNHQALSVPTIPSAGSEQERGKDLLSWSARLVYFHDISNKVLDEVRILHSEVGLRIEQTAQASGNVFIANHHENQFWFLDRRRKLVHQIPVVISDFPYDHDVPRIGAGLEQLIQTEPCAGVASIRLSDDLWKGNVVERWDCMANDELIEQQWFSNAHRLVVRKRTPDGLVIEFSDLTMRDINAEHFSPPEDYRLVSIEQMINPVIPIGEYIEP